jgi:Domain of unknown function (DUF4271)
MRKIFFLVFFSLTALVKAYTQDSSQLVLDSARNAFILNHIPLSAAELQKFSLQKISGNVYPPYVQLYLTNADGYRLMQKALSPSIQKRKRLHLEWIFYSFAGLFLLIGFIRYAWGDYFDKVFLVYLNQGFILRQKKDVMMMWSIPSVLLNLLFVLSGSFFVFFGLGSNYVLTGMDRWQVMIFIFLMITLIYFFKYFFLHFLGWVFKQKDAFDNYSFIVFLNNKIIGILMLVASFLMAFSTAESYSTVFKAVLYIIAILFGVRLINAFQIFTRQARAGLFNILLAFISLEVLPTAILLKFISSGIFLLTDGLL